jgi:hypothetical protein
MRAQRNDNTGDRATGEGTLGTLCLLITYTPVDGRQLGWPRFVTQEWMSVHVVFKVIGLAVNLLRAEVICHGTASFHAGQMPVMHLQSTLLSDPKRDHVFCTEGSNLFQKEDSPGSLLRCRLRLEMSSERNISHM